MISETGRTTRIHRLISSHFHVYENSYEILQVQISLEEK